MKSEAMANEVESILNEIRERVRTAHQQGNASVANSDQTAEVALAHAHAEDGSGNSAALKRLSAYLTTTSRAWDRLPPMYSNRKGGAARFELWIKARLKSMSCWFTWEQVNFNSAVHHALSETLNALAAYQQELAGLRAELGKENEKRTTGIEALTAETKAELDAARVEVTSRLGELALELRESDQQLREETKAELDAARVEVTSRLGELALGLRESDQQLRQETKAELDAARAEATSRLGELALELRESDQQLRQEQRVCFKQLSLETSEAAVIEDRSRRTIESRLNELENAAANRETGQ